MMLAPTRHGHRRDASAQRSLKTTINVRLYCQSGEGSRDVCESEILERWMALRECFDDDETLYEYFNTLEAETLGLAM
jgi:hypothetical protein